MVRKTKVPLTPGRGHQLAQSNRKAEGKLERGQQTLHKGEKGNCD